MNGHTYFLQSYSYFSCFMRSLSHVKTLKAAATCWVLKSTEFDEVAHTFMLFLIC